VDVRVASGEDRGSPGAPVRPVSGAVSGAGRPEASAAPARSLHGAASVAEQLEASAADPMPDIFGWLYSSSEDGAEDALRLAPSIPAIVAPSSVPAADIGQPEAVLAEQAPTAQSSLSPPPAQPLAEESRPFGPSPHDMAETSAQGARQVAQPRLFMSKFVWRIFLCLLSSPGLFLYVLHQVVIPCTCCFVGDVMAGFLTPEERAAAASVRFGPGQPGLMAPGLSEYRVFLSYSSFGLLLLPISDRPSDLSCCCCCVFFCYAGSSDTSISGWEECYLGVLGDVGGGLWQLVYVL